MKRLLLIMIMIVFATANIKSLEPMQVAFMYTAGGPIDVRVQLADNTNNAIFVSSNYTGVMPNGSGIVKVEVVDNPFAVDQDWRDFRPEDVTPKHTLDVYVNGTLYAQYRLDGLLLNQAQTSVFDNNGNLNPPNSNSTLGTDDNRWAEIFVKPTTLHIGPDMGMAGSTEMTLSYNLGQGIIAVDGTNVITSTSTGVTIPGTLTQTSGQVIFGGNVDANSGLDVSGNIYTTDAVEFEGTTQDGIKTVLDVTDPSVNRNIFLPDADGTLALVGDIVTDASLSGNGTTGNPLGIDLTNNNSWTGSQTFGTVDINGGSIDGAAIGTNSSSTGKFTIITTDSIYNTGNTTIVGSLDFNNSSSEISNSSGDVTINDPLYVKGNLQVDGGDIIIPQGGLRVGTDAIPVNDGKIILNDGTAGNNFTGTIEPTNPLTGNRTYVLPDADGTLALVGDIVTDASLTGDGSTGSQLGIDLTNSNSWTGSQTFGTVDINGGSIDGTAIGTNSSSTGKFTIITTDSIYNTGNTVFNGEVTVNNLSGTGDRNIGVDANGKLIELASGGAFTSSGGLTKINNESDDFLVGDATMNHGGGAESKMFYDDSKGAFRVGYVDNTNWDEANIGDYSNVFGSGTASGNNSTAMSGGIASGENSTAMSDGTARGENSTAMSNGTAQGLNSTAMSGGFAESNNSTAISLGFAKGDYSTAITDGITTGAYSTAMSKGIANGENSTAMSGGTAEWDYSTAMSGGIANGDYSTAMSGGTAEGGYSTAMSNGTASGEFSTAMSGGTASGNYSTAIGVGSLAESYNEIAVGTYNTDYTPDNATGFDVDDRLFVIGNGTTHFARSDAMIVYKSGDTEINGDVTISNLSGTGDRNIGVDEDGKLIELAGGGGAFTSSGGQTTINNLNDDFIVGAATLDYGGSGTETKMFYDDSKGAFRVGYVDGTKWDEVNIGFYSNAMGYNTTASGNYSTAIGREAEASGDYSIAVGRNTTANVDYSTAMGLNTTANGIASTAMGENTTASGEYSTAMGRNTAAVGNYSTAIGRSTTANGIYSTALGYESEAGGNYSTAMGRNTTASGSYSTSMGRNTIASVDYSTAMGLNTAASGTYSTAMGLGTIADENSSLAIGQYNATTVSGELLTIGNGTGASNRSNAFEVYMSGDVVVGNDLTVSNLSGTGNRNIGVDGNGKLIELAGGGGGAFTSSSGKTTANTLTDDFIFGDTDFDHTTGTESKFFFDNSKGAFRAGSVLNDNWDDGANIGDNSFAIGLNTRASGTYSAAFGNNANASGSGSVAMGVSTIAGNQYSFATGGFTEATGFAAVASGFYTNASGDMSSAFGERTTAESYAEFVVGSFNTDYTPEDASFFDEDDRAFVVGNGVDNANRSDALVVYKNGDVVVPDLAGVGTRNIGVDTDGKFVEMAGGGGGGNTDVTELYVSNTITINSTTYQNITTPTSLDANSTYMIKGVIGLDRQGDSNVDILQEISGAEINYFSLNTTTTSNGYYENYDVPGDFVYIFEGMIHTDGSGNFTLKMRKNDPGDDNTGITTDTKLLLIKIK